MFKGLMDYLNADPLQQNPLMQQIASVAPPPPSRKPANKAPDPFGMLAPGNIDLFNRPKVKNSDGSISTVRSMSFFDEDTGSEVLVPTVSDDGRIMSDDEAIDVYYRTGRQLGRFATPDGATSFAEKLHQQQEQYYLGGKKR